MRSPSANLLFINSLRGQNNLMNILLWTTHHLYITYMPRNGVHMSMTCAFWTLSKWYMYMVTWSPDKQLSSWSFTSFSRVCDFLTLWIFFFNFCVFFFLSIRRMWMLRVPTRRTVQLRMNDYYYFLTSPINWVLVNKNGNYLLNCHQLNIQSIQFCMRTTDL